MNARPRLAIASAMGLSFALTAGIYACSSSSAGETNTDGGGQDSAAVDSGSSGSSSGSGSGSSSGDTGTTTGDGGGEAGRMATVTIAPVGDASTTMGTGTFTENGNQMTLVLNLTGSIPGSRGVHVHVSGDCTNPGAHFNPDAVTKNGEFDSIVVNDAGVGMMTSIRMGLSLDPQSDGGTGIVGRSVNVHGLPILAADGGPVLTDAGAPVPAPRIGCGVIQ